MAAFDSVAGAAGDAIKKLGGSFQNGGTAQQLLVWQVLGQLIGAALGPAIADIVQEVNSLDPVLTLSPEQLAIAVIRQIIEPGEGASEAAKGGVGPGRFQQLTELASSPPSLGLIIAGLQRSQAGAMGGAGTEVDFDKALFDLGISSNYHGLIRALAVQIPPTQEVMQAWLEGQIGEDEARARYAAAGGDPTWFQTSYNAQGQAPTPMEALEMLNRGLIPSDGEGPASTSYHQAFLEGPWRDKWEAPFRGLGDYIPPPRTVQAMLRAAEISPDLAAKWFAAAGVRGETLAAFQAASTHTSSPAQKELSKSEIIDLYESQLVDAPTAIADLQALKYTAADAQLLIALADQRQATAASKAALTRIKNLYLAGSEDAAQARAAMTTLGIPDAQIANLIAVWNLEQATSVRTLTEAQVANAFYLGLFSDDKTTNTNVAIGRLQQMGYSNADAVLLLEIRNKGPLT